MMERAPMVAAQNNRHQYLGLGSTGPYPIPFLIRGSSWVRVSVLAPNGVVTDLVLGSTFTVTGTENSATFSTSTVYPNTHIITVWREIPQDQLLDLIFGGTVPSAQMEASLDKLTVLGQQLAQNPLMRFPMEEPLANPTELPVPLLRRDTVVWFDDQLGQLRALPMDELAMRLLVILGAEAVLPYRVQEIGTSKIIDIYDSNKFLRVNSADDTTITLPLTEGFNQSFSMEVSRVGLGQVTFVAAPGVIIDSMLDWRKIFGKFTSVAVRPVALNRWQIYGDLY